MDERDECKRTSDEASKGLLRHQNRSLHYAPGRSQRKPAYCLRDVRCTGGVTLIWAFVRNLRTGDAKGKGTSGANCEAESTDASARGGPPRRSEEASVTLVEQRGWVTRADRGANGQPDELTDCSGRRRPSVGGTSRISREAYVRFCERLGVELPGPTRYECRSRSHKSYRNRATAPPSPADIFRRR